MNENSKNKILAYIPVNSNEQDIHSLIYKLTNEHPGTFINYLIIDNTGNEPKELIKKTLDVNNLNYTYFNIPTHVSKRGFLFKRAIEYAYTNKFDYLINFNEGWIDNYSQMMGYVKSSKYLSSSLSISSREPTKFNVGSMINKFTNFLSSIAFGFSTFDIKGDSINIYRVSTLFQSTNDIIYNLSDDNWYFYDLLAEFSTNNFNINFASRQDLETPGSTVKLNLNFLLNFIKRIYKFSINKQKYNNTLKGEINPRTIIVTETSGNTLPSTEKRDSTVEDLFKIKKSKRDAVTVVNKDIPLVLEDEILTLPFLPEHEIDTNAEIIRLDHINPKNKNVVVINWCLTNICNYSCTYCPEALHNGTAKGPKLEDIKKFFYKIQSYHPNKTLFFEFTGGEVTYYKEFLPLIKFIKENGGKVGIISNGARKLNIWEEFHNYIDHICLSFHSEQGEPDHFYDVVAYLTDKMTTHVNIMMKPETFDMCHTLAQRIASNCQVSIAMQPLLENMDGALYEYTGKQKEILDKQNLNYSEDPKHKRRDDFEENIYRGAMRATLSNKTTTAYASPELISRQMNRWSGWECFAGVENISITMDGGILRGWCNVGGVIGKIDDDDLQLPEQPILCNKFQCSCGQDVMCTKIKV